MKVWVSEDKGVSPRTGKKFKGTLSTSERDHMLNCDHTVAWEAAWWYLDLYKESPVI